jgi:hypothetical protein
MKRQPNSNQQKQGEDFMHRVLRELGEQQDNHRHCVVLMHSFLELLLNTLIEAKCRNAERIVSNTRDYPQSVKLVLLHELGIISDAQFRVYDWFRKLRNSAAHKALFEVKTKDLQPIEGTQFEEPKKLALLCVSIFVDLWNEHVELFSPKFSPSSHQTTSPRRPDYLGYSRRIFEKQHLIAYVKAQTRKNRVVEYRYDHYPELERILKKDGTTYVRAKWQGWKQSTDWGKTGKLVKGRAARELDAFAEYVQISFRESMPRDEQQGGSVWKLIKESKSDKVDILNYERGRETPKSGGVYPRYTFLRYRDDKKGNLLLKEFRGQVRSKDRLIPIAIVYDYLFLIPSDRFVLIENENGGSEKFSHHTGADATNS